MGDYKGERLQVVIPDEDYARLLALWEDLRSPQRRGQPEYIGQRLTFNQWLVRCAIERAQQVMEEINVR